MDKTPIYRPEADGERQQVKLRAHFEPPGPADSPARSACGRPRALQPIPLPVRLGIRSDTRIPSFDASVFPRMASPLRPRHRPPMPAIRPAVSGFRGIPHAHPQGAGAKPCPASAPPHGQILGAQGMDAVGGTPRRPGRCAGPPLRARRSRRAARGWPCRHPTAPRPACHVRRCAGGKIYAWVHTACCVEPAACRTGRRGRQPAPVRRRPRQERGKLAVHGYIERRPAQPRMPARAIAARIAPRLASAAHTAARRPCGDRIGLRNVLHARQLACASREAKQGCSQHGAA